MKPINFNGTATTTEQSFDKGFYQIKVLKNDDTTNDLLFNFDTPIDTVGGNYFVLKAGESIEDWEDIVFGKFYYKSSSATVAFRLYGANNKN
jgi:hypothetical protein